jgi:hypothetical protein
MRIRSQLLLILTGIVLVPLFAAGVLLYNTMTWRQLDGSGALGREGHGAARPDVVLGLDGRLRGTAEALVSHVPPAQIP